MVIKLSNRSPNQEGDYNFNFANDDGSSRQEASGPAGVRGSYSFVTPEGEEVIIKQSNLFSSKMHQKVFVIMT